MSGLGDWNFFDSLNAVLEFLDYILKDYRLWDIPNPQGKSCLSQRAHTQVLI
jgi:hypothetical protein